MFAFYNSDWFTITLEILFLLFIIYDTKRYFQTKKREYLLNIVLAIGFFFWALVPFYNQYYTWQDKSKEDVIVACVAEYNQTYCDCLDNQIFKEYDFETFKALDRAKDEDYLEFMGDVDEECRGEGGWF